MKNKGNKAFIPQNVDKEYSTNVYATGGDWEAMEAAGAVFMPAAGRRYGTTMTVNEGTGFYWSSTPMSYQASYFMGFMGSNVVPNNDRYRSHGLSVRLVSNNAPVASTPLDSALVVKDLIEAIPAEITLEDACVKAINDAREAYNKLSEAAKGLLDEATLAKLTDAEAALTALYQVEADKVVAKINAIPTPVTLKLATRDSIESARAAFEALNAEQKALVPAADLQKLTDAEAELATLNPGGGAPAGALNGKFTINAGGDQIAFAKGNLQATTEDLGEHWTWSFAANQWNYLGIAVANNAISGNGTVSENGTVDLFGWSTAATYYGINNSYKAVDYIGDFVDWGPNMGAGWRTLTKDEWNYLIENNTKGRATVNDKNGYIFLPNDWSGPAFTPDPDNFTTNVYSGDDWTAMENAGAVFLPSGPARNGTYALIANDAKYCSSTSLNNDTSYVFTIYYNQSQSACTGTNRAYGCMVRLVSEGGGATPLDSAQVVKDLIEAIPAEITLDAACVNAVQAARDAYNALTEATKGALDDATVQKLTDAEAAYAILIKAEADAVVAKINNIPTPVELKLATRDSIESARAAYDALTADQQALVTNYAILEAAEATWAGLTNAAPAGALSGKYTINDGGDVIYFAHGNLQYTRESLDADWSTGTFRLATNQYDLIEDVKTYPAAYCTDNYGDKTAVGLFGWGTWGEGKTPNLTSSDRTLYTWSTDFSGTLEGTNTWRTLSKDEWVYLLAHNNQSYATVHGVNGLLVAPDGKDIDGKSMADWVVINDETWTTMQNDGYLFLPACGQRSQMSATANITTGDQGEDVVYYSSTQYSDAAAHNIWYKPGQDPAAADYSNKRQAFGVRLVSAGVNPLDQVQVVKGLIDAIPVPVTLDDACVNAIEAARTAYDALDNDAKAILDPADVKKLTDAEQALKDLNQAVANEVIAKINNIPQPVTLKLATRDSIQNARAAYDALNAAQQALVTNYQKLTDAEDALADLVPTPTPVPVTPTVWDMNSLKVGDIIYEGDQLTIMSSPRYINDEVIRDNNCPYTLMKSAGETSYVLKDKDGSYLFTDGSLAITPASVGLLVTNVNSGDINVVVYSLANVLDSAQHVKDLIDAIPTPVEYPTSGPAIAAALVAYQQLSDAAKGALDDADVQKMTDAAAQYAALDAIAAIEAIPAEIVYDPAVKAAIETAREKYDALIDASKALVDAEVVAKLTNAEQAWADLVALIEHTVTYIGKDGELKNEKVALLHIPNPAPDFNGHEFVRWDVKAGDFLEEGLHVKAVYTPIITTNPQGFDTLAYNGLAQELVKAGVAKDGHIEYSLYPEEPESWSANLPTATNAGVYAVSYKLVRENHEDYMAGSVTAVIAKAPVTYVVPQAYDTLAYNYNTQVLVTAGQTNDGIFEYSLDPILPDSWSADLPQAMNAGTYNVYFRVNGDMNHLDSTAVDPIAVTIAKAELTATADDKDVIYGNQAPQYTVTYAGWQGDDDAAVLTGDIVFACDYNDTTSVGTYPIVPSGVDAANYTISFVNGTLTVAKAESGCTAPLVYDTLVYNGANQTLIIAGQPMGGEMQYSLDTTVLDCWSNSLPQAKDAGTYNVYYRVKGDKNHNDHYYDLITVSIAKAALTATADDKNVVYGDAVPEYTVSYSGWMGTDESSVLTGTIAFACTYAPTSNVDEYTITPSGVDAANYIITFVNGKVTVGKAALMITAEDKNVIYGDAVPTYTATYSGWKNSDDASVVSNLAYTCEYAPTSNVGEYAIVPSGAEALNYAISYTNGKVTVSKAVLTITANDTVMIYGDEAPAFTASYSGWLNGDDESLVSGLAFTTPYQPGSPVGTYAIHPVEATALNYQIAFADGTLTVNKAVVSVSGAEVHTAKFADGHANAEVTNQGVLNGIKLNDPLTHVTTAVFSSADVAEHLTITLFYELTGDAALLANYDLQPTSEIFTTEGVIIEPFLPNNDDDPEDKESKVQEGIEVYAYGYCEGDNVGLKYHLNSGNPDQYMIEFEDSRFADIDWTLLDEKGPDGVIYITVPVDVPTGDYKMTVTFRDSRFAWLESQPLSVTFHVNLPETYVRPLFDNTIVLVDTCECFTDIQWYHRADASEQWQPISGANGHYLHVEGKLTGEYFVKAKMNGVETYTCEQTDMQTLYGAGDKKQAIVRAYPNPVIDNTNVTIENSEAWEHNLRIVNLMGVELENTTFEGNHTVVEMSGYPQGNYMISVDGIMVKVLKQ